MPCPLCNHTMQAVVAEVRHGVWWCPRCGTLRAESNGHVEHEPPRWARLAVGGLAEALARECAEAREAAGAPSQAREDRTSDGSES